MVTRNLMVRVVSALIFIWAFSACSFVNGLFKDNASPHTGTHPIEKENTGLRRQITAFAEKQVGANYKYGGRSPSGFDCSGFTTYVMNEFNIPVSGPSYAQENLGKKISPEEAKPGDLAFFRKSKTGKVFHVAMIYENRQGDLTLIHSTSTRGVVIDKMSDSSYWRSKVMTVRDVVGD